MLVKAAGRARRARCRSLAGIPLDSVANMVVLPYGERREPELDSPANAGELAAVIVEPVQSRHPGLPPGGVPARSCARSPRPSGTALVFDEVVTGFRVHPGGIAGALRHQGRPGHLRQGARRRHADRRARRKSANSWTRSTAATGATATTPCRKSAPTFFAGTFVRHPLVLAAARATIRYMKHEGPALQGRLAERTAELVDEINADLARRGISTRAETFSSWFHISFGAEHHLASLFYPLARSLGLHIQEGYPCFLTTRTAKPTSRSSLRCSSSRSTRCSRPAS